MVIVLKYIFLTVHGLLHRPYDIVKEVLFIMSVLQLLAVKLLRNFGGA